MGDGKKKTYLREKQMRNIALGILGLVILCCVGVALIPGNPEKDTAESATIQTTITFTESVQLVSTNTVIAISTPTEQEKVESAEPSALGYGDLYRCLAGKDAMQVGEVTRIVDGDTIHVEIDGVDYPVRYIGVDTPELNSGNPVADLATKENSGMVEGKTVVLIKDVSETDPYDRLLRYVLVDNVFVNYELVRDGMAVAKEYPPDTICHEFFHQAQDQAKAEVMGVWAIKPTDTQIVLTTQSVGQCPTGCTTELPRCDIKGNISSSGEKIYHMPGQRDYDKTKISPEKGEKWFCTEEEAQTNGWRRALR